MGDLLFAVYFDFETTTGDRVLHNSKMFVIRYCQIYVFHPDFKLDKIIIFRRFQQTEEEIYSLYYFSQAHVSYFDGIAFNQLKDAAAKILRIEKSTSLSEPFSIELKYTTNTLVKWFNQIFKSRFTKITEIKKQMFIRENPIDWSETKCSICNLKLSTSTIEGHDKTQNISTWYDFKEYLFFKNIYSVMT